MTITENIRQQLSDNTDTFHKIEALRTKISVTDENQKDMLITGLSVNLLSHFLAINTLIEKGLYNSAFALVRVFFENAVRLKYMALIMNDEQIEILYSNTDWQKYFPEMSTIVTELDAFLTKDGTPITLYTDMKSNLWKNGCDYTHTGPNQIARCFSSENKVNIGADFSDTLILDTLKGNETLLKISLVPLLKGVGLRKRFLTEDEIELI